MKQIKIAFVAMLVTTLLFTGNAMADTRDMAKTTPVYKLYETLDMEMDLAGILYIIDKNTPLNPPSEVVHGRGMKKFTWNDNKEISKENPHMELLILYSGGHPTYIAYTYSNTRGSTVGFCKDK